MFSPCCMSDRTDTLTCLLRAKRSNASHTEILTLPGIVVFYDDVIVGEYTADLLVEDQVIVELKVVGALSDVHLPQCRNYLRATGKPLCLLINFGRPKIEIRRVTAQA